MAKKEEERKRKKKERRKEKKKERKEQKEKKGEGRKSNKQTNKQTNKNNNNNNKDRKRQTGRQALRFVCWLVGCLTSQQQASVSQGRICTDNFTCCHTEIEVADQTFYLTQSQYTDTGPTSPSADPITPGAWQGSHWSANF